MIELRDYQMNVVEQILEQINRGTKRICVVAPTGSGKTIIAAELLRRLQANGQRGLVAAHRREIITQTSAKLHSCGVDHGIISAGFEGRFGPHVQVASVQTIWARAFRTNRLYLPQADLVLIDECHHAPARTYRKLIDAYPKAAIVGLTATPCRSDGRGLGEIFDSLIECPQVADLIEGKHLVPTVVFAPAPPDLKGVKIRAGDYVENQLAERVNKPKLVGDIISHWLREGQSRTTVCFAVNVSHSVSIRDEFLRFGIAAEHIDASTPKPERDAALARLASGETKVVVNCQVLTEGWDLPAVSCCILARPTRQMGLYRQMCGRVLRPAPGKRDAIILDHAGAVYRHGFLEDPVEWFLAPHRVAANDAHERRLAPAKTEKHALQLLECAECHAWIRVPGQPCANCGYLPVPPPRAIVFEDGDLAKVDRRSREAQARHSPEERMRWHAMLVHIARSRGYKPGWAAFKYKDKFKNWPPTRFIQPINPTAECLSWVRSRDIAYAKAKQREWS
jgi:DNA repair protein RadD